MPDKVQKTCSVPMCDRPHRAHGFCVGHYTRAKKHGVTSVWVDTPMDETPIFLCKIEGCENKRKSYGMCAAHYMRMKRTGSVGESPIVHPDPDRRCSLEGCRNRHRARGLCGYHYELARRAQVNA